MKTAVVWSLPQCSYCDRAKKLLMANNIVYEERMIGDGWTREQLLEAVPMARSAPQIFVDGEYVGGYTDLERLLLKD